MSSVALREGGRRESYNIGLDFIAWYIESMYRTKGESTKSNVKSVNEDFFRLWSPNMAYVLGFFAADGCLTKNAKRLNCYIEFVSTDIDVLEKIKSAMSAGQKITKKVRSKKSPGVKQGYRLQIGSKKIFNDLSLFGFTPTKSNIITLPDIPDNYFADYLRGYFDGDGCLSFGNYRRSNRPSNAKVIAIRFTSGSKVYLEQIRSKVIQTLNLNNGYLYEKQISGFELVFSTLDTLKILRYIYKCKNCIYMNRKYKKAMEVLASRGSVA